MTADCSRVLDAAAELALGVLNGSERADVLAHLDGCAECRQAVADLAATADRLLGVVSPSDPPTGFESRVVERLAHAGASGAVLRPVRRWSRLAVGAVSIAAAAGAFVVGTQVGIERTAGDVESPDADAMPTTRRLPLLVGDAEVGEIVLVAADGERGARLVCVLDDARLTGAYRIMVLDGAGASVASWTVTPGPSRPWSWSAALPVEPDAVARVDLAGSDGVARASTG